jgi:signal transduction histidine kinase
MNTTLINENMYQLLLSAKDSVGILLFQMIMLEMALLFIRTIRNDIQRRRTGNENGYKKDTFLGNRGNYMVCVAAAFLVLTAANQLIVAKGLAIYMLVLSEGVVLGVLTGVLTGGNIKKAMVTTGVLTVAAGIACVLGERFYNGAEDSVMLSAAFIAFLEFVLADALVKRELYQLHPKELGLLALTILICAAVSAGMLSDRVPDRGMGTIVVAGVLLNESFLIVLLCRIKSMQKNEQAAEKALQESAYQKQYMDSVAVLDEHVRKMRHDLKNYVNTLNMLLSDEEHGQERAKQYLLEYVRQTAALQEFVKTKNSVADAVLNAKLMYCKEQDIPAVISVDKNIRGLTQTELCCVLGNLLDNAIEAELKLSKAQRKIEIKIVMIEEVLDILIRNRIAEPVLQDVQKVKNIGTTKQDAENHGFGLKNVREIVKKNDGFMDLYEDSGCFCVHIRI